MKKKLKQELCLIYNTKEQSQNGKRLTCLDMTRGIAILLVVIGHSGLIDLPCNIWLSTFHLPVFFLLSGILMRLKEDTKRSFPQLFMQKTMHIMIPYLWFSLGSLCLDFLQILRGKFTWHTLWEHTVQTISLQGYSVLWFLPVLFLAEILLLLLYKICGRIDCLKSFHNIIIPIFLTGSALVCYYGYHRLLAFSVSTAALQMLRLFIKVLFAAAFMSYGYLFGGYLFGDSLFGKTITLHKWYSFLSGTLLSAINILSIPLVSLMDLNLLQLQNPWAYMLLGITGGLGCLFLCMSLPNIPLLTFYGQNSLIIMCTHVNFYVMYCSILLNRILLPGLDATANSTYTVFTVAGTMLLSIPLVLMIRIFFPFVLGQNKQKQTKTKTPTAA